MRRSIRGRWRASETLAGPSGPLPRRRRTGAPGAVATPLLSLILVLGGALHAGDDAPFFAVIQPGYPGSTEDARGFLEELGAHVASRARLPGLRGEYHNKTPEALSALARERAAFAIVSLGFYLRHRGDLGLLPLLVAKPDDTFVVVARPGDLDPKGGAAALAALEGQAVAGGPLEELDFLERIVFPRAAAVSTWKATPTNRASRALRDMTSRGRYRAVVLTGRDYRAFQRVYDPKMLEKAWESEYYPPAILVAVGARPAGRADASPGGRPGGTPGGSTGGASGKDGTPGAEQGREKKKEESESTPSQPAATPDEARAGRDAPDARDAQADAGAAHARLAAERAWRLSKEELERLVEAFKGLERDPVGKGLLETMGATAFVEPGTDGLKTLEGTYDAWKEEKR